MSGDNVALVYGTTDKVRTLRGAEIEVPVGVVDPFLHARVQPGQKFWLLLYPQTITGLRHEWTHPAFAAPSGEAVLASRRWLEKKANEVGVPLEAMIEVSLRKDYRCGFGVQIESSEIEPEFWYHLQVVTGESVPTSERPAYFHCAC